MSFAYADAKELGVPNVVHASGDPQEAELEIKHRFQENELFDYQRSDEAFLG